MDYEEKYKAALERARALNDGKDVDVEAGTTTCEYIFPELQDSESERTRKELIDFLKLPHSRFVGNREHEKWIAWLEKQSEKDSCIGCTNDKGCVTCENGNLKEIKIEQKFKVGDWIANGGANPCYVKSIFGDYYEFCSCEGFEYTKPIIDVNYIYHLWSIQDAKDGDILVASDGSIFLFAGVDDCACKYYAALTTDNYFKINKEAKGGYWETSRAVYPATKEQRDLLFQKMADAGYEWDNEKKESKKIESKTLDAAKVIEWLRQNNCAACWDNPNEGVSQRIEQFKKDFEI